MVKKRLPAKGFVRVRCPDCSNEQAVFMQAASLVTCLVCGSTLATPTGGRAKIRGDFIEAVA